MSANGFPQLDTASYPGQIFWLGVAFAVLYTLMSRLALPRVAEALEVRRARRAGNLEQAEQLNTEAEKIKTAYEKSLAKAQKAAADAMTSASQSVSEKTAEAQSRFAAESRKRLIAAEQNIARAKTDALHSLADISAEIAADMVLKITAVQVSKADAKKTVMSIMEKN